MNEKLLNSCTKEQLEDLYVNKLLPYSKICAELDLCQSSVKQLVEYYGLVRDPKATKLKHLKDLNSKKIDDRKYISADELKKYYIDENHGYEETADHFEIGTYLLDIYLREYMLKKDRRISAQAVLRTKYAKAGSKEQYEKNISEKRNQTLIDRYGSLDNFYTERRDKLEQANIDKYGYRYKMTADLATNHSELYQKVWSSKDFSIEYLSSFENKPTADELANLLNCSINCIHLWIEKYDLGSYTKTNKTHYEDELIEFLNQLGFNPERNDRKILNGKELDLYIPEKALAIEFNGNYWHSRESLSRKYHFNKSYECEQKGIRLIHVYQYQWTNPVKREILKSIIKNALGLNENLIYARKCELKYLSKKDVVEFSELNSLHGHRNASIYLGLFYNDELVELMSFGKAFFSRDDSIDYECIRSITKCNTTVIGGMNKLFKNFIETYNPTKILYYVDYNTHIGNSMPNLGFNFISYSEGGTINVANCKEVREKYGDVFNRKPIKNKEIQEYVREGKVLTIYDAGVKKYIWTKSST